MEQWIVELGSVVLLAGFGGAVRGLVGLAKIWADPKVGTLKANFDWKKFTLSVTLSACAGVCAFYMKDIELVRAALDAVQLNLSDPEHRGAYILVGMGGIDMLEGLLGIIKNKTK